MKHPPGPSSPKSPVNRAKRHQWLKCPPQPQKEPPISWFQKAAEIRTYDVWTRHCLTINRRWSSPSRFTLAFSTVRRASTRRSRGTNRSTCPARRPQAPTHIIPNIQKAPLSPPPIGFQVRTVPLGHVRITLDYPSALPPAGLTHLRAYSVSHPKMWALFGKGVCVCVA